MKDIPEQLEKWEVEETLGVPTLYGKRIDINGKYIRWIQPLPNMYDVKGYEILKAFGIDYHMFYVSIYKPRYIFRWSQEIISQEELDELYSYTSSHWDEIIDTFKLSYDSEENIMEMEGITTKDPSKIVYPDKSPDYRLLKNIDKDIYYNNKLFEGDLEKLCADINDSTVDYMIYSRIELDKESVDKGILYMEVTPNATDEKENESILVTTYDDKLVIHDYRLSIYRPEFVHAVNRTPITAKELETVYDYTSSNWDTIISKFKEAYEDEDNIRELREWYHSSKDPSKIVYPDKSPDYRLLISDNH